jgi:capsular exopolysaccharide synthesis family protein
MQPIRPPFPLPPPPQQEGGIDPLRLLRAVFRHKWSIAGLGLALALLTGFYVSTLTPVYRASASIVLEVDAANIVAVEDVYSLGRSSYDYFQTQFEILKSRNLAERVVRRLGLHQEATITADADEGQLGPAASRPWYQFDLTALLPAREQQPPAQLSASEREALSIRSMAGEIAGAIEVAPVQYSHLAYLSYESADASQAAAVVNAIVEEFISSNLEGRLAGTVQATDWLNERLATLAMNLRESEQALQAFRDQEGLVNVDGVTGLGSDELQALSQRLEDARRARIEAENIREEVSGLSAASHEQLMTIPAVLHHQVIRELNQQRAGAQRKVAELAKRYGPRHPKMIAARSDLEVASAELGREVRKVVSGISREYEVARRNEQQLAATWQARKAEVQDFNRKEFTLQGLQREVDTNRKLYDIFLTRIKSVSETGGFEKPHARIVDRAMVPTSPVRPNIQRSMLVALVLGLVLGCAAAILLDVLDNTVKTREDVSDRLDAVLLGALPRVPADKSGGFPQFWEQPAGGFAEAVRSLRTSVLLSSLDDPARLLLVTSSVPGEGKSTTVLNLATALGQMEKTLVIGADLRRPSLAQKCDLVGHHPGLSHFVSGKSELDECIEYLPKLNIHVMPAGVIPPNPLEMISARKFIAALDKLRSRFDRIVIDSAPVQAVSDALVLATYVDAVIYVVRADSTSASLAKKGIAALQAAGAPVSGVVLNNFDARQAARYAEEGYYRYSEYYAMEGKA